MNKQDNKPDNVIHISDLLEEKDSTETSISASSQEGSGFEGTLLVNIEKSEKPMWRRWVPLTAFLFLAVILILISIKLWGVLVESEKEEYQKYSIQQHIEIIEPELNFTSADLSELHQFKNAYSKIKVPSYIPEGYQFEEFSITITSNDSVFISYKYSMDHSFISIAQSDYGEEGTNISFLNIQEVESTDHGTFYYNLDPMENTNTLMLMTDDNIVFRVTALVDVNKEELRRILDGLEDLGMGRDA